MITAHIATLLLAKISILKYPELSLSRLLKKQDNKINREFVSRDNSIGKVHF